MRLLHAVAAATACACLGAGATRVAAQSPRPTATVVSRWASPVAALEPGQGPAQATPSETVTPAASIAVPTSAVSTPTPTVSSASATPPPTAAVVPLQRPILVLSDSSVEPGAPAPGSEIAVLLEVRNVGAIDAENVQLMISSLVFRAGSSGSVFYKEEIDAGETRPFDMRLRVDSAAASGVHVLEIGLSWEDASGLVYTEQTSIGIQVVAEQSTRPQLVVVESRVPGRVVAGVPFDIALEVRNGGGSEARNVVLTTSGGALAPRGASPPTAIAPGASATLTLRAVAANTTEPGAVTQLLELRYGDPDGQTYVDIVSVGLVVSGDAALGPLPLVTRYTFGDRLAPGQVFELELEVENVGPTDALRTRLVLGSSEGAVGQSTSVGGGLGVFAPLGTSNVRYLGRLAAGASQTIVQRMVVDGAAKPGVYVLDVGFEYTDPDGRPQVASGVISLLVSRPVRLEINPVDVVSSTVVGASVPFGIEIVNAGDAKVNVGNAEVRGGRYVDVVDGTAFVGPMDAGAYFSIDTTVVSRAPGPARITVVVEYTDDFNEAQTLEESFSIQIEAAPESPELEPSEESPPAPLWLRVVKGFLGLGASAHAEPPAPAIGDAEIGGRLKIDTGGGGATGGGVRNDGSGGDSRDVEPESTDAAETPTP